MLFKTVITTHWESDDGRFIIRKCVPDGFCAEDTYSDWIDGWGYCVREYADTLDDAMAWCLDRVS